MSFEDLHQLLRKFYTTVVKGPSVSQKERVYLQAIRAYKQSHKAVKPAWFRFGAKQIGSLGAVFGLLALLMIPSLTTQHIVAGTVLPQQGPVEIIRDKKSFLATDETPLLVGDLVKVGRNGQAKVSMPNKAVSTAGDLTQFQVTDVDAIYLVQGKMDHQVLAGNEVATKRGFVKSGPGSRFEVSVTSTGETRVDTAKNEVEVFDLYKGSLSLREGESLTLRSDTELSEDLPPSIFTWTDEQSRIAQSKLIIARSKALRAVENQLEGRRDKALEDLASAEDSFRSLVEVTQSERQRELSKRISLDFIALGEVLPTLERYTQDQYLLTEVKAVEHLLELTRTHWNRLAFGKPNSGVPAFDKMVLIYHIYSLSDQERSQYREILADKYARIFLQDLYTSRLKIDQISSLNEQVDQLPNHPYAKAFLQKVAAQADPYLRAVLDEKIQDLFGVI